MKNNYPEAKKKIDKLIKEGKIFISRKGLEKAYYLGSRDEAKSFEKRILPCMDCKHKDLVTIECKKQYSEDCKNYGCYEQKKKKK